MACWQEAAAAGDPLACRHLSIAAHREGNVNDSLTWMRRAVDHGAATLDQAFAEEYLALLVTAGEYAQAWRLYHDLPAETQQSERCLLSAGRAALELGHDDFVAPLFDRVWAGIREGDNTLIDLWYRRAAGGPEQEPPARIDSRMYRG
jgi:hypothetical protein